MASHPDRTFQVNPLTVNLIVLILGLLLGFALGVAVGSLAVGLIVREVVRRGAIRPNTDYSIIAKDRRGQVHVFPASDLEVPKQTGVSP